MSKLTLTLPWIDSALMPNRKNGRFWASTQKHKSDARNQGYYSSLGKRLPEPTERGTYPVKITFVSPDARNRDLDNCLSACKHLLDGVALGLGVNDKQFRPITIDDAVDVQKKGFLLMEIGE